MVKVKGTPKPIGNFPYFKSFQELFMLTGTTTASGICANNVFNPFSLKGFGAPFRLRVPSGKITAVQLFLATFLRSEEHTSELQSRENLVCRLLLEKKKQNT